MNEDDVRALVRETIARRLPARPAAESDPARPLPLALHASHFRYALPGSGGACLIEPAVQCTHCGFCQSHGY
jgi:hypothetical protein